MGILLSCSITGMFAQSEKAIKTTMDNARYEVVQSEMMRSLFFMLDKYTGKVYQNVISGQERTWRLIRKVGISKDTTPETKPNYQLFLGGYTVKDIFLYNVNTGETWYLFHDSDEDILFFSKSLIDSDIN